LRSLIRNQDAAATAEAYTAGRQDGKKPINENDMRMVTQERRKYMKKDISRRIHENQ